MTLMSGGDASWAMKLFDKYWFGNSSDEILSQETFEAIAKLAETAPPISSGEVVMFNGKLTIKLYQSFYGTEFEYAIGKAFVYYDMQTKQPIGFEDTYTFKSHNNLRLSFGEGITRQVERSSPSTARSFKIRFP
jgi:hypothetical protein